MAFGCARAGGTETVRRPLEGRLGASTSISSTLSLPPESRAAIPRLQGCREVLRHGQFQQSDEALHGFLNEVVFGFLHSIFGQQGTNLVGCHAQAENLVRPDAEARRLRIGVDGIACIGVFPVVPRLEA